MNYKQLFLYSYFLLFYCSCTTPIRDEGMNLTSNTISCDIESSKPIHSLTEICDSVSLISLDNSEGAYIGFVKKIVCDSLHIYISSNDKLFIYNWQGGLVNVIAKTGHAYNEYVELHDFTINSTSIFIADTPNKKILQFTLDGKYQKTVKTDKFPEWIAPINDRLMAVSCCGTEESRLLVLDLTDEKVVKESFPYEERMAMPNSQTFISYGNHLYYKQPFSNAYYLFNSDGEIESSYMLDFGKYTFHEKDLEKVDFGFLCDSKGNVNLQRFGENDFFFQFEFACERISEDDQFISIISKNTGIQYLINSSNFTDDILFYQARILPDFNFFFNNDAVGVIYPVSWKDDIETIKDGKDRDLNFEKTKRFVSKLSDDQNPVVCVYHFKETL